MPRPNAHRLYTGRVSEFGRIYLVTTVVDQRNPLFSDWHIGRLLVGQLRSAHEAGLVDSLAWVVMPDHFHWLFQLQNTSLACLMNRVKSRSSRAVNRRTGSSGRLWQKGYHDRAVRWEEDLRQIARYVIANPVRAGLVRRGGDYPLWDAAWL
ncbi:transposase [Pseudomonas sp. LS1212]|uniref:REP-associated tyrosine transposase n=1 Tax=Pseudomonas sp. LS1212 TaxID=2972478 RepID=UPI00215C78CF|nr:transposase [Pseudomonas sp. LS1212]UVJ45660.1 transposase [Pseudomonas sp. LS1212]